ncbi:hypothetical protein HELRODRAFT_71547, partial [Helobdella robusta]|uniref:Major facilitator superfamily (MFS) profile domain-containing protein n=1 Tax=Helobdella robusta TaxID=6412 RepID=T1G0N1_HELRO
WDLVCDLGYIAQTTQTLLVVGVMLGAVLFTALSDRFGRKPIFLLSQWCMVVVGIGTALSPNIYFFCAMRFLTGALQQGILLTGFVLACELFAAKHRTFAGTIIENFWAVAWCVFPLFAFLFKNWQYLQIFISLSGMFTIPLYWLLPESVLWLSANGKIQEAERVIKNAAKMNKIMMPDPILDCSADAKDGEVGKKIRSRKERLMKIFKKEEKTEGCDDDDDDDDDVYYGLSLSTAQLAGNRYLNGFLNAVVEIPAYTSSYFVLKRFGRRYPLIAYHLIAGLGLLANAYLDHPQYEKWLPAIILFNMLGKFGITGSFGIVFLYAPEIFPTTLRNQALGIASLFGRVGNMLATFNSYFLETHSALSGSLFGVLSIAGGLLVLFLPETLNRPLPQTIEDIESWYKKPDQDQQQMEPLEKKGEKNEDGDAAKKVPSSDEVLG